METTKKLNQVTLDAEGHPTTPLIEASIKWHSLDPMQRYAIIQLINVGQYKTIEAQYNACIQYLAGNSTKELI